MVWEMVCGTCRCIYMGQRYEETITALAKETEKGKNDRLQTKEGTQPTRLRPMDRHLGHHRQAGTGTCIKDIPTPDQINEIGETDT